MLRCEGLVWEAPQSAVGRVLNGVCLLRRTGLDWTGLDWVGLMVVCCHPQSPAPRVGREGGREGGIMLQGCLCVCCFCPVLGIAWGGAEPC